MMRHFETKVWIPRAIDEVFDFFENAENLQIITPDWLDFKILTPLPIQMQRGARIDYTLRLYGVRMRWRTLITDWRPPHLFVDTQISGPYRIWIHTHRFEEQDGGTWMRDEVQYLPPGGVLAHILDRLFVRRRVQAIFEYRRSRITSLFQDMTHANQRTAPKT